MLKIPVHSGRDGFNIPVFGLGTWMMGGDFNRQSDNDDERDIAAVRRAVESGITHIDTAELYAAGHAETLVGKAISGLNRADLLLASKVWNTHLKYDDVLRAAEGSLKRLGTDYLDLYFIHKPNDDVPLKQTIKAMDRLVEERMVRHVGISNFTLERTRAAVALADHPPVATQVHYNLIYREPAKTGLVQYCDEQNIVLIAWRPVQKGLLTDEPPAILRELCGKYGKTAAQIAINWLINQRPVVTLSTMRSPEHLEENLNALEFSLTPEDQARLTDEFPQQQEKSDAVPLQ